MTEASFEKLARAVLGELEQLHGALVDAEAAPQSHSTIEAEAGHSRPS
jgi:hypothetical protein